MSELLEIGMIVLLGVSWPMNLLKALRSKMAKGTSLVFLVLITAGYVCGILSKFMNAAYMAEFSKKWYVLIASFLTKVTKPRLTPDKERNACHCDGEYKREQNDFGI